MTKKDKKQSRQVTVDGMMSFDKLENGLRVADFVSTEQVEIEPFVGNFRVQGLRNGCVTMAQKPKRIRRGPIRRGDRWSISLTRDGFILINWRCSVADHLCAPKLLKKDAREIAEALEEIYEETIGEL